MSALHRLIYASTATPVATADMEGAIASILDASGPNNDRVGVTGMLLAHKGFFVQALEGSRISIDAVYRKVARDRRHTGCLVLGLGPTTARSFRGWAMCGRNLTRADDEILAVLSLRADFDPMKISAEHALNLLKTIHGVHERVAA